MKQSVKQLKLSKNNLIVIGIAMLYLFLCLYKITDIPIGYNVDEAGTAIDAYYLANFGVDRYGVQFPAYFENYGGGQNALNQYLCAIMVKIFGFSVFWLKIPGVVLNLIGLVYLIKLFKKLFSENTALTVGLIYAISPYSIMRQRTILESNLAMPIMIVALYYTYRAIYEKKLRYWQISGILYGIVIWAYMYELLVLAVFLIGCLAYCIWHKKINIKQQAVFITSFLLVQWPLILFNIINIFELQTIQIGLMTIPRLELYRGSELYSFLDIVNIIGALLVFIGSQFYYDSISYNQTVFGIYYITTQVLALYVILSLLKNFKQHWKNIKENFSFKFLISTLLVWNFIQQIISIQNCNKLSIQYIAIMMMLAIWFESYKKLPIWNNLLKYIIYGQYLVLFITFQITYYSGTLCGNSVGDYSFASYKEILEDNDIKNSDKVYTTENAEQFILFNLLNSYEDGNNGQDVVKYTELNKDNFSLTSDRLNSVIDGQYIIETYNENSQELIDRLDKAVEDGVAQKKVYDYYNYYIVG